MAEVSLKVLIAGRSYPLTVKKEDEQTVLDAARMINEKVKEFETNYFDLTAFSVTASLTSEPSSFLPLRTRR